MVAQVALVAWATGLAYEDWRWRRLRNALLLAGIFLGLVHWAAHGVMPFGVLMPEGGLAAAFALLGLLPFYRAGWLGAGDVKFCAVIGWLAGLQVLLATFLLGSIAAGAFGLMLLVPGGRQLMSSGVIEARLRTRIPFGTGLAMALIALTTGWIDAGLFHFW